MYKNMPAINALTQPISILPKNTPVVAPNKHNIDDNELYNTARLIVMPDLIRTAKSPISCGNSWHRMAMDVLSPTAKLLVYDTPMAMPSKKLCSPSPVIIMNMNDLVSLVR